MFNPKTVESEDAEKLATQLLQIYKGAGILIDFEIIKVAEIAKAALVQTVFFGTGTDHSGRPVFDSDLFFIFIEDGKLI